MASSAALATPVAALVSPGPRCVSRTPGFPSGARVTVGGVRRHLLVPRADVADTAAAERVEHADDGMAGQAEDHLDAEPLEILREQVRGQARFGGGRQRIRNHVDGCAHYRSLPRL
jgi:hypothetical protein